MTRRSITIITSDDPSVRDTALDAICRDLTLDQLLAECMELDAFRRRCDNLYQRVRALFFLYAIHQFHLPVGIGPAVAGLIPFEGHERLLTRRFEEAIDIFLQVLEKRGPSDAICSALAAAYKQLGFATLANQVRRSVRSARGNQWMFRMGHPADHPLRIRNELLVQSAETGLYPILCERTPVRMDLSHSAWSDIFFLGMDFPEGARVLNVSIDLAVRGRDEHPRPPIETYLRVVDKPIIRLVSVDLGAWADIDQVPEVFDFARDYLGLLKAAVIAAGIVPSGLEGSDQSMADLLGSVVGKGLGLEIVSNVKNIPKGSRLAVSTNLLASLISLCMRATGQARAMAGPIQEHERRVVAARAILGEWLGGSGGGWQDSGGVWPGIKLIEGSATREGDPEQGVSRGRLLPDHKIFGSEDASDAVRQKLQDSLVLVHGGLAQDVGPILEMVTEKYLLRSEAEWRARRQAMAVFDQVVAALRSDDVRAIGAATTRNFLGPLQTIIPWASNYYTESLIDSVREQFNDQFWGFWMLGGMSGGGMGFIFDPRVKSAAQEYLQQTMSAAKRRLQQSMPFAMEPVVYDFAINEQGTCAQLLAGRQALLPSGYYTLMAPRWLRTDPKELRPSDRAEMNHFSAACRADPVMATVMTNVLENLLPRPDDDGGPLDLASLLGEYGFDREAHERIRGDLKAGRIGLAQNRLSPNTTIEDVEGDDVVDATKELDPSMRGRRWGQSPKQLGQEAIKSGAVAVVTLAAGSGSRWTQGAGVTKALHPFCRLGGKHRSFIEVHLAKSRQVGRAYGVMPPHIITTSYLTYDPIERYLTEHNNHGYEGLLRLSRSRAVGLRMVPMVRDLRFAWEKLPQQMLDEQAQKVRDSLHAALIHWAQQCGEASDYTDNLPMQCLHPVGHWYEVPNLLRNGVLKGLLDERPELKYLMLHNIDTLGANVAPTQLGLHIKTGRCLTFEVITRRIEDRGGGLARVDGRPRLLEGLATPREADEFQLSYYNSMTTWIDIDQLLEVFGLSRSDLTDDDKIVERVRRLAARVPTYVTLKDVKKRWGHGQEDVFPVAQFEKLWSDMTTLPEVNCGFVVVPRLRGQQLKDQAQLDVWLRDGSAAYLESLCAWA